MSEGVDAVRVARAHTIAAGTAYMTYTVEKTWKPPKSPARGPVGRVLTGVGKAIGKRALELAIGGIDLRHQRAEGFIHLAGRRFMIDYRRFAEVQIGNQRWNGRSG